MSMKTKEKNSYVCRHDRRATKTGKGPSTSRSGILHLKNLAGLKGFQKVPRNPAYLAWLPTFSA